MALLLALLIASYAVVLARLAKVWVTNDDMSHGIFVPLLAGYIVWQRRRSIASLVSSPNLWGLALLVLGAAMLCIGPPTLPTFAFLTRVAFLFSLVGVLLYTRGSQTVKLLAYPLALLALMIPLPEFVYAKITLPLQLLASANSERTLELLGYSVLREGNILHMPNQTLSVVEACSGLRSLFSLMFLGQAYIYVFDSRPWMRLLILVATIPIAIVANVGRITFSAIVSQNDSAWLHGSLHASTAWVMFAVAFFCLVAAHQLFARLSTISFAQRS